MTVTDSPTRPTLPESGEPEAAPGILRTAAEAVNAEPVRQLYATRQTIYAKRARGTYRSIKWLVMIVTLAIYYALPWIRWERGTHLPDQAVLLDFPNGRFFFFFLEIWPQEFYFVTGLLILAALVLFLVTAVAGRVWCGYTCPQTVWTDMMIAVERFWQGDRNARMRLDKQAWGLEKIWKKVATHLTWIAISLATGGAFVFYFRDAPTLALELANNTAPAIAYIFLGIFAGTTYLLGGLAREQVCIYMCPWPRIQGALFDRDSLLVSYKDYRGETRGPHKKGASWDDRGDCIDCKACVAVCPMGIDIRDGPQLECIQCALCIDACNDIMPRIGRPTGLIDYDTVAKAEAAQAGTTAPLNIVRPRTLLYTGLIVLVSGIMLWALLGRTVLELNVLPDRNPLFVVLSDGSIRNGYTVKILNKRYQVRRFQLSLDGLAGARMKVVGYGDTQKPIIDVIPDDLRALKVYLTLAPGKITSPPAAVTDFRFIVTDLDDNKQTHRATRFRRPAR